MLSPVAAVVTIGPSGDVARHENGGEHVGGETPVNRQTGQVIGAVIDSRDASVTSAHVLFLSD